MCYLHDIYMMYTVIKFVHGIHVTVSILTLKKMSQNQKNTAENLKEKTWLCRTFGIFVFQVRGSTRICIAGQTSEYHDWFDYLVTKLFVGHPRLDRICQNVGGGCRVDRH